MFACDRGWVWISAQEMGGKGICKCELFDGEYTPPSRSGAGGGRAIAEEFVSASGTIGSKVAMRAWKWRARHFKVFMHTSEAPNPRILTLSPTQGAMTMKIGGLLKRKNQTTQLASFGRLYNNMLPTMTAKKLFKRDQQARGMRILNS